MEVPGDLWMVEEMSVMNEDWDFLVILDACRYDYFCRVYKEYLQGQLEKVISPGSCTTEWCRKSFPRKYDDVIYISANPFINSKTEIAGFRAKDHFHKVVDVWSYGWDEELGTVHPIEVNQAVLKIVNTKLFYRYRLIVHYLQPHAPYISRHLRTPGFPKPRIDSNHILKYIDEDGYSKSIRVADKILRKTVLDQILDRGFRFLVGNVSWRIRELLNLPPASPMDAVRRMIGCHGLREAYVENLRLVLEYVKALVENISGNVVITSDHGELLGERGRYSHFSGSSDPALVEVPWLRIKSESKCSRYQDSSTVEEEKYQPLIKEEVIRRKLKSLGYI